ncbi:Domain of uncharacterised function (DUF1998) [Gordonia paraffinivorans]|uniref:Domain of uncharacterized function (DUF1998) n=1 Tax=Gordonia paraffinivorans TaxID=175628 RepID=A0ABD7UYX2_9ACTN|nr:DUF1998 domain-containing protein [Gordonia paraffinivorans]VFA81721.1 Domain of uncharacterised function (DUF1998) [Gordonia paraffinivorans]
MALRAKIRKAPPIKASVRRSQLITTYGVGSVLPVESESFMIAGLEHWNTSNCEPIEEPRLRALLGVHELLAPPGGESGGMVPMVRFPEWVSCPKCNRLDNFWRLADKVDNKYVNKCRHCISVRLVPSRFVACCVSGHIQDFPFRYWTHRGRDVDDDSDHSLRMIADPADSSLAGIAIVCSCGVSRSLEGALGSGALTTGCGGRSPWLDTDHEPCGQKLVGLQRGASNVWFADVKSALTVDRSLTAAEEILERIKPELEGLEDEDVAVLLRIKAKQHKVDPDALVDAFRKGTTEAEDYQHAQARLREEEYEALGREDEKETFVCVPEAVRETSGTGRMLDLVSKVPRLREVRALTGFARVSAVAETKTSPGKLTRNRATWMPAIEVLGEGIFVRFRESAVVAWESSEFAQQRAERISSAMQDAAPASVGVLEPVRPRLLLLHSLSHALMRELALDTGYPASSIRERIYAAPGQAGILLYTASADAAGSLGGLCAQGTVANIVKLVEDATESAQWCSADPVCLESGPSGAGAANLAACHSCMLAPEVSCELQNRYLDRACLVGNSESSDFGFLTQFDGL